MAEILKELVLRDITLQEFIDNNYTVDLFTTGANEQVVLRDVFVERDGVPDADILINGLVVGKLGNASGSEVVDVNSTVSVRLNQVLNPGARFTKVNAGQDNVSRINFLTYQALGCSPGYKFSDTLRQEALMNVHHYSTSTTTAITSVMASFPTLGYSPSKSTYVGGYADITMEYLPKTVLSASIFAAATTLNSAISTIDSTLAQPSYFSNSPTIINDALYYLTDAGLLAYDLASNTFSYKNSDLSSLYSNSSASSYFQNTASATINQYVSGTRVAGNYIFVHNSDASQLISAINFQTGAVVTIDVDEIVGTVLGGYGSTTAINVSETNILYPFYNSKDDTYTLYYNPKWSSTSSRYIKLVVKLDDTSAYLVDSDISDGSDVNKELILADDGRYFDLYAPVNKTSILYSRDATTTSMTSENTYHLGSEPIVGVDNYKFNLKVRMTGVVITG